LLNSVDDIMLFLGLDK